MRGIKSDIRIDIQYAHFSAFRIVFESHSGQERTCNIDDCCLLSEKMITAFGPRDKQLQFYLKVDFVIECAPSI